MVKNQVVFFGLLVLDNRVLVQGCTVAIVIDDVCKSVKSDIIVTISKTVASNLRESDLDSGDESENDDDSLQEAYEKMYTQWLKVCATNHTLGSKN